MPNITDFADWVNESPKRQCRICGALLVGDVQHSCGGTPTLHHFNGAASNIHQLWSGPLCSTCGSPFLGTHECDPRVLRAKAQTLLDLAQSIQDQRTGDAKDGAQ